MFKSALLNRGIFLGFCHGLKQSWSENPGSTSVRFMLLGLFVIISYRVLSPLIGLFIICIRPNECFGIFHGVIHFGSLVLTVRYANPISGS